MRATALAIATVVIAGGIVVGAPQIAHAAEAVTITSPADGSAVFGGATLTASVSEPANTYCVAFNQVSDGTQIGYSCSANPDGTFSATDDYASAGIQEITATADTSSGASVTSAPVKVVVDPGAYHPLTPQRVLDTRTDYSGGVAAHGTTTVFPTNAGVPDNAAAVAFNLTETGAAAGGFITAYAGSGTNRPTASNLNFNAGQTVANLVTVSSNGGDVTLYNGSSGTVQLIADVVGYYDAGGSSTPTAAGHLVGLTPSRILDTRAGIGRTGTSPIATQGSVDLKVAGRGGVPASGAAGVVFALTETAATRPGNFRAFPQSAGSTETSSLNFVAQQDVANLVELPLDASGNVTIENYSPGSAHAIVDVVGYYTGAPSSPDSTGLFTAITPQRLLDTRYGTGAPAQAIPAGGSVDVPVADLLQLPSGTRSAAALNVTATGATTVGYLTVYPTGAARPTASSLNFVQGQTTAASTLAALGTGGSVTVYNGSSNPVQVIVDADGFYS